jgi:uncharacterized membrane protein
MARIDAEVQIAAPLEAVWRYVQDFDRRGEWDVRIRASELVTPGQPQPGSLARYHLRAIPGTTLTLRARYTSLELHDHSAIVFEDLPWWQMIESAAGCWRFTATAEGTLFQSTFRYRLKLGRLGEWLDARLFRRQLERETAESLANLKRRLEAKSFATSKPLWLAQ